MESTITSNFKFVLCKIEDYHRKDLEKQSKKDIRNAMIGQTVHKESSSKVAKNCRVCIYWQTSGLHIFQTASPTVANFSRSFWWKSSILHETNLKFDVSVLSMTLTEHFTYYYNYLRKAAEFNRSTPKIEICIATLTKVSWSRKLNHSGIGLVLNTMHFTQKIKTVFSIYWYKTKAYTCLCCLLFYIWKI